MATHQILATEEMVGADHATKGDTLNRFINLITAQGDILYGTAAKTAAALAKGDALQVLTMNAGATAPEWTAAAEGLPKNYISGLLLSHDADTEHDINITAGKTRDTTDANDIVLASEITKQADAAWSVGDDAGGMDTGAIPASATLHVWLIKRSDTGVVDALFSISATAPTMPADYDYKRRIGSYRTDATNNIINGDWWGTGHLRTFMYDTPIMYDSGADPGTNALTAALATPGGISVIAIANTTIAAGATASYVSSLDNADLVPSTAVSPLASSGSATNPNRIEVKTNTSSQVRGRINVSDGTAHLYIVVLGWVDSL